MRLSAFVHQLLVIKKFFICNQEQDDHSSQCYSYESQMSAGAQLEAGIAVICCLTSQKTGQFNPTISGVKYSMGGYLYFRRSFNLASCI